MLKNLSLRSPVWIATTNKSISPHHCPPCLNIYIPASQGHVTLGIRPEHEDNVVTQDQ